MRPDLLRALPLALIACAMGYVTLAGRPEPVEKPATAGEIDFDTLHRQANAALEALRHSHERQRRLAAAEAS